MCRSGGFTLVELVVVITLLGVLSMGTVGFIRDASDGYASTSRRTEMGSTARLAAERISRELRSALPNSVRVSGNCLEFIPVDAGSTYVTLPVAMSSSAFDIAPPLGTFLDGSRVVVFPDLPATLYVTGSVGAVSPPATFAPPDVNNVVRVTLAATHQFPVESPDRRLYVVDTPVSFCVAGGALWRYAAYGYRATQPLPATLPATMPGRSLVGANVVSPTPFSVASATLTRNAEVVVDLQFADAGDSLNLHHLVQLRNVP